MPADNGFYLHINTASAVSNAKPMTTPSNFSFTFDKRPKPKSVAIRDKGGKAIARAPPVVKKAPTPALAVSKSGNSPLKKQVRIVLPTEASSQPKQSKKFSFAVDKPKNSVATENQAPTNEAQQREDAQPLAEQGEVFKAAQPSARAAPRVSLFSGNPAIPYLQRVETTTRSEQVFSGSAFASVGVSDLLCRQLEKHGCQSMTVVQERGIPAVLTAQDVLIKSQTGSGKTLAYAVPVLDAIFKVSPPVTRADGIFAIIIVPTRELAQQTYDWVEKLCRARVSVVPCLIRGGQDRRVEKKRLSKGRGVNIVVATPGRLCDHIDSTEGLKLSNVRHLVLDEADRMLELGYEKKIAGIVEAIKDAKDRGDGERLKRKREKAEERYALSKRRKVDTSFKGLMGEHYYDDDFEVETADNKVTQAKPDADSSDEEVANEDIDDAPESGSEDDDEAKPNFYMQTTPVVEAPEKEFLPVRCQTILLSATLNDKVASMAGIELDNPTIVDVSPFEGEEDQKEAHHSSYGQQIQQLAVPKLHSNAFMFVPPKLRLVTLASIILSKCMYGEMRKILVFMATQNMVDYHTELFNKVLARHGTVPDWMKKEEEDEESLLLQEEGIDEEMLKEIRAFNAIHKKKNKNKPAAPVKKPAKVEASLDFMQLRGNMGQNERSAVFERFKACKSGVLLTTDVAARGLDLPSVACIVQYTPPVSVTDFVHRIGRTSRADHVGSALMMLAPTEEAFISLLDDHKISLREQKYETALRVLTHHPPHTCPDFQLPRNPQHAASRLQLWCERLLLSDPNMKKSAIDAFHSFLQAYASYPRSMMRVLCYKHLHLGHYAKSFGLLDAPGSLGAAAAISGQAEIMKRNRMKEGRDKRKMAGVVQQKKGVLPRSATVSEFDSGLEGLAKAKTEAKVNVLKRHKHLASKRGSDTVKKIKKSKSKK